MFIYKMIADTVMLLGFLWVYVTLKHSYMGIYAPGVVVGGAIFLMGLYWNHLLNNVDKTGFRNE